MEKLDLKDRKILYHLDLDSRQSYRSIGRKVGLSKDIVTSRIKRLQEKGIIKSFYTIVDESILIKGTCFRCYFSYQNINPKIKQEIIDYLVESKFTVTVRSLEGSYDLLFFIIAKSMSDAYSFWEKLLDRYRDYFSKKIFNFYYHESHYDYLFLLDDKEYQIENRNPVYKWYYKEKTEEIDDLDNQIFKLISQDSRISAIEIAKKLNSTAATISNRIRNLRDLDIIRGFTVNIDLSKIGYYMYKVDIELKDSKEINKIIKYIEKNPYLAWFFKSIGYVDLEFGFILKNAHQLHQIMEDLSNKFPNTIKNYIYFCITETHKIFCF